MIRPLSLKIIVAGQGGVGKTTLLRRYQSGEFIPASTTVGINFVTHQIQYKERIIILSVWDYAGESRFKSLFPGYSNGSKGGLAVFDTTRPQSLDDLSDWISIIYEKNGPHIPIILVGTKIDSIKEENFEFINEKAQEFSKDHNLRGYFNVSSKSGEGVNELFDFLSLQITQSLNL
ncbi:MAG: Transforming protein p29 precursor [Candidatus Heimdallarchaeota archaeon LC_3]|nr:MAG: Transforming protein p29 precursor [Candidatus Heimdallarchaeota archaeon LC_3]